MNVVSVLVAAARTNPDATAISWIDRPLWSYRALMERAATLAAGFKAYGLAPGDRIAIAMSNSPAFYEVVLGAWMAGLVPAPQNCRLHPAEIAFAAKDCGARLCLSTQDQTGPLSPHLEGVCPVMDVDSAEFAALHGHGEAGVTIQAPTDPAWLFYTSGTTGKPKGATLTHRTLNAMLVSFLADSGAAVEDHILHMAPMSHASGFLGLSYLARTRNNVILPTGALDIDHVHRAISAFGPLSFFAVPTIVRRLVLSRAMDEEAIKGVHRIFFGGAPMYVEDLKEAIAKFGSGRLWHLYGQGETPNTITYLPPQLFGSPEDPGYEDRLASVGIPRSGVCVRVVREDGAEAAIGEVGEVVVQGDTLMAGYWDRPQETAAAIRNGWLHTGDLGRMNEAGYLTLVDRSKDMIISGGSNIYPREIEEVLLTHPSVAECAVVGVPDREWGEAPIAFVVPSPDLPEPPKPDGLNDFILAHLARYKRPKAYRFVGELPKSAYGKILKTELRKVLAGER